MADWYPKTLAALIPWHANFNTQVQATGTTYGLSAAQKAQVAEDNTTVAAVVNYAEVVEAFAQAITEHRNIMLRGEMTAPLPATPAPPAALTLGLAPLPGIEARTRQYAGIIRSDPDFTPAIGELYGITAPAAAPPSTPSVAAVALTQSQVQLNLFKAGYDLLAIDSKRGSGGWEQIGVAQVATYIDARAPLVAGQPEVREYRVQGMSGNARVGALSAVVSVVTVP